MLARLFLLTLAVLFVPVLAFAAALPDPSSDLPAFLAQLGELWASSAWAPAIGLTVVGMVWLLRTYASGLIPWIVSRRGALVLVGLSALGGSVAQQVIAGVASIPTLVVQAVLATMIAVGTHSGVVSASKGGTSERLAP